MSSLANKLCAKGLEVSFIWLVSCLLFRLMTLNLSSVQGLCPYSVIILLNLFPKNFMIGLGSSVLNLEFYFISCQLYLCDIHHPFFEALSIIVPLTFIYTSKYFFTAALKSLLSNSEYIYTWTGKILRTHIHTMVASFPGLGC